MQLYHIGLEVNIEEADYSVIEGEAENTVIKLQFRRTQNPFTVTVYPVNITQANKQFNVGNFFTGEVVDDAMEGENTRIAGHFFSMSKLRQMPSCNIYLPIQVKTSLMNHIQSQCLPHRTILLDQLNL